MKHHSSFEHLLTTEKTQPKKLQVRNVLHFIKPIGSRIGELLLLDGGAAQAANSQSGPCLDTTVPSGQTLASVVHRTNYLLMVLYFKKTKQNFRTCKILVFLCFINLTT